MGPLKAENNPTHSDHNSTYRRRSTLSHRRSHLVVGTRAAGTTGYPGMSRHTGTGPENDHTNFL